MNNTRLMHRFLGVLLLGFWLCLPQLGLFGAYDSAAVFDEPSVITGEIPNFTGAIRAPEFGSQTPPGGVSESAIPSFQIVRHWLKKTRTAPDHLSKRVRIYQIHRVFLI